MAKYINRLKVVLAEQHKTNLWLAKTLGKDPATVSKWCTNTAQPSLETLHEIAQSLKVDIRTLLNATDDALMACGTTKKLDFGRVFCLYSRLSADYLRPVGSQFSNNVGTNVGSKSERYKKCRHKSWHTQNGESNNQAAK